MVPEHYLAPGRAGVGDHGESPLVIVPGSLENVIVSFLPLYFSLQSRLEYQ